MVRRRIVVALTLGSACALVQLGERPGKRAEEVGFTGGWGSVSEKRRLELREEAGWTWTFPHEPPAYRERQEARMAEILALEHYQERLDNWVQYTQVRSMPNFTKNGFDVVDVDAELHARLKERLHRGLEGARPEGKVQGIYGDEQPVMVNHGERDLLGELQPRMEEWVPTIEGGLQAVTAYGIRAYRRGASLGFHTDRVDTHIISGILHVDHSYDDDAEPWPIEIEGHDGLRHAVDLKPGQMLLYESAKCPHGRSGALRGDYYASIFVHFKPRDMKKNWPYTQKDVWLAVPPGWDAKPLTAPDGNPGERWAGAFLTTDMTEVAGMAPRNPGWFAKRDRSLPKKVERQRNAGAAPAPSPAKRQRANERKGRAAPIDPQVLKAAEEAAEAVSDDDAPDAHAAAAAAADPLAARKEAAAKRAPPPRLADAPKTKRTQPQTSDGKVADADVDDATEGDDGAALEFADDQTAGGAAGGRTLKARSRRNIPSRKHASRKPGAKHHRGNIAAKIAAKKKGHLHRAAPIRTKAEHEANKQRHREMDKDDDDDDDEDDDDDDEEEEDDDDDEVETVVASGFVLAGLGYWIGGISALGGCSIFIRRAILTKGRSIKDICHGKSKKDDLPMFDANK